MGALEWQEARVAFETLCFEVFASAQETKEYQAKELATCADLYFIVELWNHWLLFHETLEGEVWLICTLFYKKFQKKFSPEQAQRLRPLVKKAMQAFSDTYTRENIPHLFLNL